MADHFDDVDNLVSGGQEAGLARLFDGVGKAVHVSLINSSMVQADDGGMQVQVGVQRGRVAVVVRQAEALGEEHEGRRESVVELAVALPEGAVLIVAGPVVVPRLVDMFEDLVKEVAHNDGAREAVVGVPLERFTQRARGDLLAGCVG